MSDMHILTDKSHLTNNNQFIEDLAEKIYQEIKFAYPKELLIKKYGVIPENILVQTFKKIEEKTINEYNSIIFLDFDKNLINLCDTNEILFYQTLVGKILGTLENTKYYSTPKLRELRDLYESDFEKIYSPLRSKREQSILKGANIGINLEYLFSNIQDNNTYQFTPLINISFTPNFENVAVISENKSKNELVIPDECDLEKMAGYSVYLMQNLFICCNNVKKAISIPGWTIDILTYSSSNQKWNQSIFPEDLTLDEVDSRFILNL